MAHEPKQETPQRPPMSLPGLALRITWMAGGNFALAILAILIIQTAALSVIDVVFWTVVAGLLAVRYVDVTRFGGLTAEGEPASLAHWRRYAVLLLITAAGAWVLAHAVGRLVGQ